MGLEKSKRRRSRAFSGRSRPVTPKRRGEPPHPRAAKVLLRKPMIVPRAARIIAAVTVAVTVLAAVAIHFTDRQAFPNIGDSLWWAIQTVTTVGYGDLVPASASGRLVAAIVMLVGIGFLTVITAAITSTFIETARKRIEGTATDVVAARLDEISARLERIEAGLKTAGGPTAENRGEPQVGEL